MQTKPIQGTNMRKTLLSSITVIGTVFVGQFAPSSAFAQPADQPLEAYSSTQRQAAQQLLEVTRVRENLEQTISRMLDAQVKQNPNLAPFKDILQRFYARYMSYESLRDDIIKLYVSEFSESELRETVRFYQSATGQKIVARLPGLMQKGNELGMKRVQDHLPELRKELEAANEKLQRVGTPPGAAPTTQVRPGAQAPAQNRPAGTTNPPAGRRPGSGLMRPESPN